MKKHGTPKARALLEIVKKRMNWVLDINKKDIDFISCVFINGADFNLHIGCTFGRSKREQPAKVMILITVA